MQEAIDLPRVETRHALTNLLSRRRSTKKFDAARGLNVEGIAGMAWAASGTTTPPHRVSPSARASNPIAITLVAGKVSGIDAGSYRYDPHDHTLVLARTGDHREDIAKGTLDAVDWLCDCPALLLMTANMSAARQRFPGQPADHGEHFVWMEAGHSAQNVYLSAAEQNIGTCLVAGFNDDAMRSTCRSLVPQRHQVLGILALGYPAA